VLSGGITFWLRDQRYQLAAQDTIHFVSHEPHRWANQGQADAIVLWVTTERGVWQGRRAHAKSASGHLMSQPLRAGDIAEIRESD